MTTTLVIPQTHERWVAWYRVGRPEDPLEVERIVAWQYEESVAGLVRVGVFTDDGRRVGNLAVQAYGDDAEMALGTLEFEHLAIVNAAAKLPAVVVSVRRHRDDWFHALAGHEATWPRREVFTMCRTQARAMDPRSATPWPKVPGEYHCRDCHEVVSSIIGTVEAL